jgi:hypothetical protein
MSTAASTWKEVYRGKSENYETVLIIEMEREIANYMLAKCALGGSAVEIQTHVGGGIGYYNKFSFRVDLDVPGKTLFVVLAKLPEDDDRVEPLGFYSTEKEAREAIAYKGFVEVTK